MSQDKIKTIAVIKTMLESLYSQDEGEGNAMLDRVHERLDELSERIESLETAVEHEGCNDEHNEALSERIDACADRLDKLERQPLLEPEGYAGLAEQVNDNMHRIQELENDLEDRVERAVEDSLQDVSDRLESLESFESDLEERVNRLVEERLKAFFANLINGNK